MENLNYEGQDVYSYNEALIMAKQYMIEAGGDKLQYLESGSANEPDYWVVYDKNNRPMKRFMCYRHPK